MVNKYAGKIPTFFQVNILVGYRQGAENAKSICRPQYSEHFRSRLNNMSLDPSRRDERTICSPWSNPVPLQQNGSVEGLTQDHF